MAEHGLTRENLLRTFPPALRKDPSALALGDVTAEALAGRPEEIGLLAVYPRVDKLPGELLDILAYDFKVDWYDYEYPLPAKRSLIRGNILAHKRQGTVYATKSVLRSLYPKSEMEEWFEYDGEPGHFRLYVDVSNSADADATPVYSAAETLRRLSTVKRLSAHLDSMVYQSSVGVVIRPKGQGYKYHSSFPGQTWNGTVPWRDRRGGLEHAELEVDAGGAGYRYNAPLNGTVPWRDRRGGLGREELEVDAGGAGYKYNVPLNGTVPWRDAGGETQSGAFSATAEAEGFYYRTPVCGTRRCKSTQGGGL